MIPAASTPRAPLATPVSGASFDAAAALTASRKPSAPSVDSALVDAAAAPADSHESSASSVDGAPFDAAAAPADSRALIEPRATSAPVDSTVASGQHAKIVNTTSAGVRTRAELSENPSAPLVCVIADPDETHLSVPTNTAEQRIPAAPAQRAAIEPHATATPADSSAPIGSRVTTATSAASRAPIEPHAAAAPADSRTLIEPRATSAPVDSTAASEQRAKIVNTTFAGTRTRAELCENPSAPLVCVIADPDETRVSVPAHENLLVIDPGNWNDSLSPWPAPACFRGGGAFGGHADRFLQTLTESVLPAAERELGLAPTCRALCGYSLAGLFALYALYRTDRFTHIASASGSLWYDGFLDFLRINAPRVPTARIRLSLGDREEFTKNPRLAAVGTATRETVQILRAQHLDVTLTMNPGNHFFEPDARLSRLIEALEL